MLSSPGQASQLAAHLSAASQQTLPIYADRKELCDLMPRIARHLSSADLGSLRLTCRALRRLLALRCRVTAAEQPQRTTQLGTCTTSEADVNFLSTLPGLRRLTLRESRGLRLVKTLTQLETLRVQVAGDQHHLDLEALSCLGRLRELQLDASETESSFASTHALSCLAELTGLSLRWCVWGRVFCPPGLNHGLSRLANLRELVVQAAFWPNGTSELPCLTKLEALTRLDIGAAHLTACASLPGLRCLSLDFFYGSHSLRPLSALQALTALELWQQQSAVQFTDQDALGTLTNLQHLTLVECSIAQAEAFLPPGCAFGLVECPSITSLTLLRPQDDCLWCFADCTSLRELDIFSETAKGSSFFLGAHCPPQQFTVLVCGDASRVVFDAELVSSARVEVQQVDWFAKHTGMSMHW